jgi:hypothetical protein
MKSKKESKPKGTKKKRCINQCGGGDCQFINIYRPLFEIGPAQISGPEAVNERSIFDNFHSLQDVVITSDKVAAYFLGFEPLSTTVSAVSATASAVSATVSAVTGTVKIGKFAINYVNETVKTQIENVCKSVREAANEIKTEYKIYGESIIEYIQGTKKNTYNFTTEQLQRILKNLPGIGMVSPDVTPTITDAISILNNYASKAAETAIIYARYALRNRTAMMGGTVEDINTLDEEVQNVAINIQRLYYDENPLEQFAKNIENENDEFFNAQEQFNVTYDKLDNTREHFNVTHDEFDNAREHFNVAYDVIDDIIERNKEAILDAIEKADNIENAKEQIKEIIIKALNNDHFNTHNAVNKLNTYISQIGGTFRIEPLLYTLLKLSCVLGLNGKSKNSPIVSFTKTDGSYATFLLKPIDVCNEIKKSRNTVIGTGVLSPVVSRTIIRKSFANTSSDKLYVPNLKGLTKSNAYTRIAFHQNVVYMGDEYTESLLILTRLLTNNVLTLTFNFFLAFSEHAASMKLPNYFEEICNRKLLVDHIKYKLENTDLSEEDRKQLQTLYNYLQELEYSKQISTDVDITSFLIEITKEVAGIQIENLHICKKQYFEELKDNQSFKLAFLLKFVKVFKELEENKSNSAIKKDVSRLEMRIAQRMYGVTKRKLSYNKKDVQVQNCLKSIKYDAETLNKLLDTLQKIDESQRLEKLQGIIKDMKDFVSIMYGPTDIWILKGNNDISCQEALEKLFVIWQCFHFDDSAAMSAVGSSTTISKAKDDSLKHKLYGNSALGGGLKADMLAAKAHRRQKGR